MEINATRRELESFVEYLPVGVIVFDKSMHISLLNDLALKLLGVGLETILSGDLLGALHEDLLKNIVDVEQALQGGQKRLVFEKDNKALSCTIKHIVGEDSMQVIVIIEDATQFRRIEQVQRDFIANILQKLRGPLSTLKTSLSMMQNEKVLADAAQAGEILGMGYHEVNRLVDLTNDLRDLFLIDTGLAAKDMAIEEFDVSAAFSRAVDEIGKLPAPFCDVRTRLACTGETHFPVRADFAKTKKICAVLLKNAVLYSDAPSPIVASFSENGGYVAVCIRDKGMGVTNESIPFIFDKYFREDNSGTRTYEGNGLGLFIAKSYADIMGGSIYCESVQGKGSAFFLSLPQAPGK